MTAVAHWPAQLPDRPTYNYTEDFLDVKIEEPTDLGPFKARRVATAGLVPLKVEYEVDEEQAEVLLAFFKTTLASGTLMYRGIHPRTGDSVDAYMSKPQLRPIGGLDYRASFTMRVLETA